MAEAKLERIYTVPLVKAYEYLHTRRTERAVKLLRAFVAKHMKADIENVRISEGVNKLLWRDSIQKPPRRIKVRVVKEGEMAKAWLLGEEEEMKKIEDAKKKAEEAKRKEEEKKAEAKAKVDAKKPEGAAKAEGKPSEAPKAEAKPEAKQEVPKASNAPSAKMQDVRKEAVKPKTA